MILSILLAAVCLALPSCGARHDPGTEPVRARNLRAGILRLGTALIGLPYQYGGSDITGFDCSGFVHYVFHCHGVEVPRTAKKQGQTGRKITLRKARPGDILVFKLKGGWHSGILTDPRAFVHAPQTGTVVRREDLTRYWVARLRAVVDVLDD